MPTASWMLYRRPFLVLASDYAGRAVGRNKYVACSNGLAYEVRPAEGRGIRKVKVNGNLRYCSVQPDGPTSERLAQRVVRGREARLAEELGMGIILMRVSARCGSWTSWVFQRLMAWAAETAALPEIDAASEGGWSRAAAAQLCFRTPT